MENIVRIKKLSFYAYHGVFRQEQSIGGKFEADIDVYTNFDQAVQHDNLSEAVDYKKVYSTFIEISESRKYHLIETLAMHIVDELFSRFDSVTKIILRVRKNNPPIGGVVDSVEVEVMKTRAEFEAEIRS